MPAYRLGQMQFIEIPFQVVRSKSREFSEARWTQSSKRAEIVTFEDQIAKQGIVERNIERLWRNDRPYCFG